MQPPYDERRAALESLKLAGETFATPPSITNTAGAKVHRHRARARSRGRRHQAPELALRTRIAQRRLDQGEELPHPRGGHRRLDRGQGRTRRQSRCAACWASRPATDSTTSARSALASPPPTRQDLLLGCAPLARKTTPFSAPLSRAETSLAHFVRPTIVGEVQFAEWTNDGHLRQPSWRGLRSDKSATRWSVSPERV